MADSRIRTINPRIAPKEPISESETRSQKLLNCWHIASQLAEAFPLWAKYTIAAAAAAPTVRRASITYRRLCIYLRILRKSVSDIRFRSLNCLKKVLWFWNIAQQQFWRPFWLFQTSFGSVFNFWGLAIMLQTQKKYPHCSEVEAHFTSMFEILHSGNGMDLTRIRSTFLR